MTQKEIKNFFQAIKNNEIQTIKNLVKSNNDFVKVCSFSPPKSDDGQSGLQVAFKTGNFEIAEILINEGADVNFSEQSGINEWTAPVLHDCIRATIFNCSLLQKDNSVFDKAFSLLKLMLKKGADPNGIDSYGNNCLHRAIMDSRQMIVNPNAQKDNTTFIAQLRSVFNELIRFGANPENFNEKRPSANSMIKNFRLEEYKLIE